MSWVRVPPPLPIKMGLFAYLANRFAPMPNRVAESVMGELCISDQIQRLGARITPQRVSSIIQLADTGYTYQLVDLGNEFRQKECHLQSVLHTRETSINALPWEVAPFVEDGEEAASDARSSMPTGHPATVVIARRIVRDHAVGDLRGAGDPVRGDPAGP